MGKENILLSGLLILVVAGVTFAIVNFSKSSITEDINMNEQKKIIDGSKVKTGFESISSGSTNEGDVSVELTPSEFINGKLEVEVAVNTHSVDLSQFDLKEITTLEYDGKFIKPLSAFSLSGHHSFGTLIFNVGGEISGFIIRIRGIPKVEERIFEWR